VIRRIVPALAVLALATPAWAVNKDIERLQIQVADLQRQVADLVRMAEDNQAEIRRLNESLADQNALLKKAALDGRVQDEAIQSALRDVTDRMSEMAERLQALSAAPPAAAPAAGAMGSAGDGGPPGTPPAPAPAAGPPPRELYSQSYADYARGNYDVAIQGFTEYLRNYPSTDFSDNAQYWIGESYYGKKAWADAIAAWDALVRDYPSSDKLPDARVKKGMALEKMGRRKDALREYRFVLDRYPNAPAARIARERLNP
jgi:tol-pal system protein YbgF